MILTDVYEKISKFFQLFCICMTLGLLLRCLWIHIQNDDIAKISFRHYGEDHDDVYPDITLCFKPLYDEQKLIQMGTNELEYDKFISGEIQNENLAKIDYDNVSLQLKDYIVMKKMVPWNDSIDLGQARSLEFPSYKCFSFSIPSMMKINHLYIGINNTVFRLGRRSKSDFVLTFNYPNQLVRSWQFSRENWPNRANSRTKSYIIEVFVKAVEIFKRRNKSKAPCIDGTKYDTSLLIEMIRLINCTPPYWKYKLKSEFPFCSTKAQMKTWNSFIYKAVSNVQRVKIPPPCTEIQSISRNIDEYDLEIDLNSDVLEYMEQWNDGPIINKAWRDKGTKLELN